MMYGGFRGYILYMLVGLGGGGWSIGLASIGWLVGWSVG
jgi:hypothetical protein